MLAEIMPQQYLCNQHPVQRLSIATLWQFGVKFRPALARCYCSVITSGEVLEHPEKWRHCIQPDAHRGITMTQAGETAETQTHYAQSPGGITELAGQIRTGDITPVPLVQCYLDRIAESDAAVEAWLSVDGDGAMAVAEQLGKEALAGELRGPLHGIPIGVKDIIDVAGWPTKCNSATRQNAPPAAADAEIIAALRTAGARAPEKLSPNSVAPSTGMFRCYPICNACLLWERPRAFVVSKFLRWPMYWTKNLKYQLIRCPWPE